MGEVLPLVNLCHAVTTSLYPPTVLGYMTKLLALVAPGNYQMVAHPTASEVYIESSPVQENLSEGRRDLADPVSFATRGPSR